MKQVSTRGQIAVFLILTFALTWLQQYFIIQGDGERAWFRVFLMMWTPGIVALLCSFLFDRSFVSLKLRKTSWASLIPAYFIPAIVAILILVPLWTFSITTFALSPTLIEKSGGVTQAWLYSLFGAPTLGLLVACAAALGEETGWRGFLHTKLSLLNVKRKYLITGIIWSLWHWPLILFTDYNSSVHPWINIGLFTVSLTALSVLIGCWTDRTNSVLPAVVLHGSHNLWLVGITPLFFQSSSLTPYLAGEAGLFCALLYLISILPLLRRMPLSHD